MSLILDLIFPKYCYSCNKAGFYICPSCAKNLEIQSIKTDPTNQFEGIVSVFKYRSFIKKIIFDIKYNFVSDITDDLAKICVQKIKNNYPHLLQYWQSRQFTLIPIPLHYFRHNWRGFNQSALLGEKIAKSLNLSFSSEIIKRKINTISQVKLKNKRDRSSNLSHAFILNTEQKIPENIILFDDVATTRSTLISALNTLKVSHASHHWGLTLAG